MKKIKNVVFALLVSVLAVCCLTKVEAAEANGINKNGYPLTLQQFGYDYEFHIKLKEDLKNGKVTANINFVSMDESAYNQLAEQNKARVMARLINLKNVTYDGKTGKELYNYLKGKQNDLDEIVAQGNTNSQTFQEWNTIINTPNTTVQVDTDGTTANDVKNAIFCYEDNYYEDITIPESCEDEYYMVIVAYVELTEAGSTNVAHQYMTSRVYEVKGGDCSCKVVNGKYYNKENKVVTEVEYNKDCGNVCKIEDGKYYNSEGKVVKEEEYNKDCNSCKIVNGKYYNKDGKLVTKAQWDKDCGNPDTGIENPYIIVAIVVAAGAGIAFISKKKKYV